MKKTQNEDGSEYNSLFKNTKGVGKDEKTETSIDKYEFSQKQQFFFENLGLPLTDSLSGFGVDSIADYLGESNRPIIGQIGYNRSISGVERW